MCQIAVWMHDALDIVNNDDISGNEPKTKQLNMHQASQATKAFHLIS